MSTTNPIISLEHLLSSSKHESSTQISKSKGGETVKTLESFHNQHMAKLKSEKENLGDLKQELKQKREALEALEESYAGPTIANHLDILALTRQQTLEDDIRRLDALIERIESGTNEADYFLQVGDILFSYTDAQERIAMGDTPVDVPGAKKARIPANSVYSYFSNDAETENPSPRTKPTVEAPKKASAITNTVGFQRDKALESYLHALDPDSIQHETSVSASLSLDYGTCAVCESEMLVNETFLDCPECGHRDYILVDSEKPSYKDPPREMSYYAYKKINHLNEWLAQFQAKETTEISNAVLDQIRTELRKERITDMSKLKPSKLKEVIKKMKLSRCYDHVAHILNRLNGISAPALSREIEDKLRYMFKEIQFSFVKHCPKKRSNFLSYSYVLYKFCELLELDDYLPCFPLLKSREKLYMQDKIWQKICEDMGWEFIRTV